ncbi:hypothetical protein DVH24_033375 [Malus domestica]|uniref:Uncharacterized protein n=1 Tax=Malus domestica TaxID=3750 RepID=A0A498J9L8_MALDO|nr:hypothetical protein DVH24_033375 [Malus domestica]
MISTCSVLYDSLFPLKNSLEGYHRKQNKLIDFQVQAAPGETWQGLLAALHLQHINVVNSSQKLTVRESLGFLWRLEEAGVGVEGGDGSGEKAYKAEEGAE